MDYARILYSEISFKPYPSSVCNNNNGNNNNKSNNNDNETTSKSTPTNGILSNNQQDEFRIPIHQLCDPSLIRLDWLHSEKIGCGLVNVGNTCFLNSVLQCLTYCPPLYNFLVKLNGGHSSSCKINQFCMLCEMEKHVKRIKASSTGSIKPMSIVQRLKYINRSFQFGRQEDAHEFLRYIIDHMWKACLMNHDINARTSGKLDPKIKETTVINQIFGGYHRSQVLCLTCNSRSNTFDFFMDFILDIRHSKSLEEALKRFTQPETLENENAYKCSKCRKKVTARKKFTVYKAPNVATFQLKRFDSDRIFGGKVTKFISYPEEFDLRPYMSDPTKPPIKYQISAVLVHVGHSSNSGHYFCFIKNSDNLWYRMDDSNVSLVSRDTVLQQQAYVLFYNRRVSEQRVNPVSLVTQGSNALKQQQQHGTSQQPKKDVNNQHQHTLGIRLFSSNKKNCDQKHPSNGSAQPEKQETKNSSNQTNTATNSLKKNNVNEKTIDQYFTASAITTWQGSKSNLEEDSSKRKFNEMSERDKFNEELDLGKTKKIKSHSREDRFSALSKLNPFQRFSSDGYSQFSNKRDGNSFQKHNGRQYDGSFNKNRFNNHHGKHKGRNFYRR